MNPPPPPPPPGWLFPPACFLLSLYSSAQINSHPVENYCHTVIIILRLHALLCSVHKCAGDREHRG